MRFTLRLLQGTASTFFLTWNCTHIANAEILVKINHIVAESGYFLPTICTPDELFGGEDYE